MSFTVAGRVVDNNHRPVKATISFKGKPAGVTKEDGSFKVELKTVETRAPLTFSAEGYVSNTRVFNLKAKCRYTVALWPIAYTLKFDPSKALDIEMGRSRVLIPANSLIGPKGEKPGTAVSLRYTLFDVSNAFQRSCAPGDFTSQSPDGTFQRLESYGIFDFDIRDSGGRPLSLKRGAKIDLSIPLPTKLAKRPPKKMGFYEFNAVSGRWIPGGTFIFNPSTLTYNGDHHSSGGQYNLDHWLTECCITIKVINISTGAPMDGFWVQADGGQYTSWGTTNADGLVCLIVEMNSTFIVTANGTVGTSDYGTPNPPTLTSPNINSHQSDCGDPVRCPCAGSVFVDLIVGTR
jgi:hypothetical protein